MNYIFFIIFSMVLLTSVYAENDANDIDAVCGVNYSNGTAVTTFPLEGMSLSVIVSLEGKTLSSINCTYFDNKIPQSLKDQLLSFYGEMPNVYSLEIVDKGIEITMLRRVDGNPVIKAIAVFKLSEDGRRFVIKDIYK